MEILSFTPPKQIIERVRNVTMLNDKLVFPYKDADISIEDVNLDEILPTQLYVLQQNLEVQKSIRESLLENNCDTLQLFGGIVLQNCGITTGMLPPVVEDDGEHRPCLIDGTHRAYLAKQLGMRSMVIVHISGVPIEMPMIPLPNRWDEIVEYEIIPTDKNLKKRYRDLPGEKYNYYRDFSNITGIAKDPRSEKTE